MNKRNSAQHVQDNEKGEPSPLCGDPHHSVLGPGRMKVASMSNHSLIGLNSNKGTAIGSDDSMRPSLLVSPTGEPWMH